MPTWNDVSTPAKISKGLETINPNDIKNSLESYVMKPLNTPKLNRKTPSQTPLLDEHPASQLLLQLHLQTSDLDDPLYKEAMADKTEPQRKKQKTEEKTTQDEPTSNGNMCDIIMKAAKMISDAIDSNTRAVRQSEKAINKVSEELGRIERNVNCIKRIVTQKPNEFEENRENYIQNKKSTLKSVVKKHNIYIIQSGLITTSLLVPKGYVSILNLSV
jgi:archaellum component FlaC